MWRKPEPYTLTTNSALGFEKGLLISVGDSGFLQKKRTSYAIVVAILDEYHCSVRGLYWRDYPGIWWGTFTYGIRRVGRFLGHWFDKIFDPMG